MDEWHEFDHTNRTNLCELWKKSVWAVFLSWLVWLVRTVSSEPSPGRLCLVCFCLVSDPRARWLPVHRLTTSLLMHKRTAIRLNNNNTLPRPKHIRHCNIRPRSAQCFLCLHRACECPRNLRSPMRLVIWVWGSCRYLYGIPTLCVLDYHHPEAPTASHRNMNYGASASSWLDIYFILWIWYFKYFMYNV